MPKNIRLVVGISGGSGVIYGIRLLEVLHELQAEVHLVMSDWGMKTIIYETGYTIGNVKKLATHWYDDRDLAARISSGSFRHEGMVVVPCSMKSLAGIACGYTPGLLERASDVTIKEGRKLIIVPRETPLSAIHLENMLRLARSGAVILPAMPAFYIRHKGLKDIVDHLVGKILDQFGIKNEIYPRWRPILSTGKPTESPTKR